MASEMGYKTAVIVLLLIGVAAADVNFTGIWKQNFGWEITCSWKTFKNDSLQSVRLLRNGQQFQIFRPQEYNMKLRREQTSDNFNMKIDCETADRQGQRGRCVTTVELTSEPAAEIDVYRCEVSGERPTFRQEAREYEAIVTPSNAQLIETSDGRFLNCSSYGIPPPQLTWTLQDTKIPVFFANHSWSKDTKLWHSWATLTRQTGQLPTCTPKVTSKYGKLIAGLSTDSIGRAAAVGMDGCTIILMVSFLSLLLFR